MRAQILAAVFTAQTRSTRRLLRPRELFAQRLLAAREHHPRRHLQEITLLGRQGIGAQRNHDSVAIALALNQGLERGRKRSRTGGGRRVQNDQIHGQTLGLPIGLRAHQLLHRLDVGFGADLCQHNGRIARHTVRPPGGLAQLIAIK